MTPRKTKAPKLVKITASPVPPWRQSTELTMSCPTFYAESEIKGNKMPGGLESARGTEIHHTAAAYAAYCAAKQIPMDLSAFDNLSKGAGPVAARILFGMRETLRIDWKHLIATELTMSLDENFNPTEIVDDLEGICGDSKLPAHYFGTLDTLYGFYDEQAAEINDYKSHPRPFDPDDTIQSKTYTVFVFTHFPWVQKITFRLTFVRYANLSRTVTYTRQDMPALIEAIRASRERQKLIHRDYDAGVQLEAVAGGHCIYCPLLANATCPIAKWNPAMNLTPEQRLNFNLFYSAFSAVNNKAMKEYVDGTGKNITLKDFNGKAYTYGPRETKSQIYPLFKMTETGVEIDQQDRLVSPIIELLDGHAHAYPEDTAWLGNIQISSTSIKSYLKSKKRTVLDQAMDDVVQEVTKAKLAVSKPLDMLPNEVSDDDDSEDF